MAPSSSREEGETFWRSSPRPYCGRAKSNGVASVAYMIIGSPCRSNHSASRIPIAPSTLRDPRLSARATATTRVSPARSCANRSTAPAASLAKPRPCRSGTRANRSATPRPSARSISPATPANLSSANSWRLHIPNPRRPHNAISSASSSAVWNAERTRPSIVAKERGSPLRRMRSAKSRPVTGRMASLPVRIIHAGFMKSTGQAAAYESCRLFACAEC